MKKIKLVLSSLVNFFSCKSIERPVRLSQAQIEEIRSHIPVECGSGNCLLELNTLRKYLEDVLQHHQKHVLIKGDDIIGYFDSHSAAEAVAYERFGTEAFFFVHEVDELTRPPVRPSYGRIAALIEVS